MRGTIASDTFSRVSASGWGSADTGQAWSQISAGGFTATDWSVSGGLGVHSVSAAGGYRVSYLGSFAESAVDIAVTGSVGVMPTGAPLELANLLARGTSITAYYLYRVAVDTAGVVTALIYTPDGTVLGTVTVPGITYTAGLQLRVRAQAVGRVHRMRVWRASLAEPVAWVLSVVDDSYTGPGFIGVRSGISNGNTNTKPVSYSYDNFASVRLPDFPRDRLPLTVLAAFGADLAADPSTWPWTDITSDVRVDTVSISPGRRDETSQANPASCTFQLINDARAYSAHNPMGPNYPNVKRNTPVWVLVDPSTRFFGYADGWSPSWDTSGRQSIVTVAASGILRRLTHGRPPIHSPLYRAITARPELRAYWPMEDRVGSTTIASAIPSGPTLEANGLTFEADATEPGSAPLPRLGSATGAVVYIGGTFSGTFGSQWQLDWYYLMPSDPQPNVVKILSFFTNDFIGSAGMHWDVILGHATLTGQMNVLATNFAGTEVVNTGVTLDSAYYGQWIHARLMARQSGGSIQWQLVLFPLVGSGVFFGSTVAGTIGAPFAITIPQQDGNLSGMSMGHLAVFDAWDLGAADQAQSGFTGELVTTRLTRLCADQGVPITITGTSTTTMGPQSTATFVELLRECEAADLGVLFDGFDEGLGYITRSARYTQPAALTVDMANGQVAPSFAPIDDDQRNRNKVTVSRKGGSSATYEDASGPLGSDPLTGIGLYDSELTINVSSDSVLPGYASWLVHLGTADGFRYPNLNLNLVRSPALIDDWMGIPLNARIDVLNIDSNVTGHGPGTVALLMEGYTETLGPRTWKIAANCSPGDVWDVAIVDDATFGRVDTSGAELTAGINSSATSIQVTTTTGPLWSAADGAFDINVGGERMTVTAISSSVRDSFSRTTSGGWGTSDSGHAWSVTSGSAADFSTDGTQGLVSVSSLNAERHVTTLIGSTDVQDARVWVTLPVIPTGAGANWGVLLRYVDVNNYLWADAQVGTDSSITLRLIKRVGGVVTQFATTGSSVTHSTSVPRVLRAAVNGSNFMVKAWASSDPEPAEWQLVTSDSGLPSGQRVGVVTRLMTGNTNTTPVVFRADNFATPNPQTFTVTRSVNGAIKSHLATAAVQLWTPAVVAL